MTEVVLNPSANGTGTVAQSKKDKDKDDEKVTLGGKTPVILHPRLKDSETGTDDKDNGVAPEQQTPAWRATRGKIAESALRVLARRMAKKKLKRDKKSLLKKDPNDGVVPRLTQEQFRLIDWDAIWKKVEEHGSLSEHVKRLEAQMSELLLEHAQLRIAYENECKRTAINEACSGLTLADAERLKQLAEGMTFTLDFRSKLDEVKATWIKQARRSGIAECLEELEEGDVETVSMAPEMKAYVEYLSRFKKQ
jgi:hypothetical protein